VIAPESALPDATRLRVFVNLRTSAVPAGRRNQP